MQKIVEILERRSEPHYYVDCDKGRQIHQTRKLTEIQAASDIYTMPREAIIPTLERIADPDRFRRLMRSHSDGRVATREQVEKLRGVLFETVLAQEVEKTAEVLGCDKYESCILCPVGRDLAGKEIYDYAMGTT